MTTTAALLIDDLSSRTNQCIKDALQLKSLDIKALNWKENPQSWSVLECMEHLNLYGDFYLPEIENQIQASLFFAPEKPEGQEAGEQVFKSSLLGNYFAKSMLPSDNMHKMDTFKDKNPAGSHLDIATIDRFIQQQNTMLELLNMAREVDLTNTKTALSITKLIKLRLGDTFRVVIYHNQRHLLQANKVILQQNLPQE